MMKKMRLMLNQKQSKEYYRRLMMNKSLQMVNRMSMVFRVSSTLLLKTLKN